MKRVLLIIFFVVFLPVRSFAVELPFSGFLEYGVGARVVDDEASDDEFLLEEARFQVDFLHDGNVGSLQFKADFVYDGIDAESRVELRVVNILVTPVSSIDLKVGRQIITWGTGDFIFLNDLFPKDFQSFFIGRDDEYLKKPSDAIRGTWFGDLLNLDLVWIPVFEPDGFISGERLSFYDFGLGRKAGTRDGVTDPREPDKTLGNSQLAGRLYGIFGGWEAAIYGFRGNGGQPRELDPVEMRLTYPRLEAWGASLRGALLGGIGNAEVSLYRSLDDLDGTDPNVPNSEVRGLIGYSREIISNHAIGLQAYIEHALDFPDTGRIKQDRWWVTLRYTGLLMQQNLILSWFSFYSPNVNDAYLRPKVSYKFSDEVLVTLGGNLFLGKRIDTFFGQLQDNTNIYGRIRYSF
ncbi:MAG: hypothetical protein GTO08_07390 [Deltaproteobacteria bacterium]|nr:hypothetical protein [Deltaproteobacteria bacterium]